MPVISVIVPVYNVEKYLHQCIESILSQTFEEFELLLIDDGSIDNSGKICDEYAEKDSRIKVIHQHNQGQAKARNVGIDAAGGEWVAFVDSDDYIASDMMAVLLETAVAQHADMVMCNFSRFKDGDEYIAEERLPAPFLYENTEQKKFLSFVENSELSVYHIVPWGKIYHKTVFEGIRYPEGRIYEDSAIAPALLDNAKKIVCLKDSFYFYRTNPQSTTQRSFSIKNFDYLLLCKDRIDYFLMHRKIEYASKAAKDFFFFYFENYFKICCTDKTEKTRLYKFRKLAWKVLPTYLKIKSVPINQKISAVLLLAFPNLFKKFFKR